MALRVWAPLRGTLDTQGVFASQLTNYGATVSNNGPLGPCYYFNNTYMHGTWNGVNCSQNFSCSFWFRRDKTSGGNQQLVAIGMNSGWNNIYFGALVLSNTSNINFSLTDGSNYLAWTYVHPFTLGKWHHYCFVFNHGNCKLYLDDTLVRDITYEVNPKYETGTAYGIGAASNGAERAQDTYISDVRFYDHSLTPKEVHALYQRLFIHYLAENDVDLNKKIVYDTSGYGMNANITGTMPSLSNFTPRYTKSLKVAGTQIRTPNGSMDWFDHTKHSCTIAAWYAPNVVQSGWGGGCMISHNQSQNYQSFGFVEYIKIQMGAVNGSYYNQFTINDSPVANEWHHYVVTLENGSVAKAYLDGKLVQNVTISWGSSLHSSQTHFAVACDPPGSIETSNGYYSDIRCYLSALSAADVKELYETSMNIDSAGNISARILT